MYIKFDNVKEILPECRSKVVFRNPDIYIALGQTQRFVIWESILSDLDGNWLDGIKFWPSQFDFGSHPDDYNKQFDDYNKQFDDYITIELLQFPSLDNLDVEEKHAFVFNEKNELYIRLCCVI
ncbi:hypothetical protein AB4390_25810, partial [Vibrio splendidus]